METGPSISSPLDVPLTSPLILVYALHHNQPKDGDDDLDALLDQYKVQVCVGSAEDWND